MYVAIPKRLSFHSFPTPRHYVLNLVHHDPLPPILFHSPPLKPNPDSMASFLNWNQRKLS